MVTHGPICHFCVLVTKHKLLISTSFSSWAHLSVITIVRDDNIFIVMTMSPRQQAFCGLNISSDPTHSCVSRAELKPQLHGVVMAYQL
jgi:hypothetical protein